MEQYFARVEAAVRAEEGRIAAYMNPSSKVKTLVTVLNELMIRCKDKVKESFPLLFRASDDKIQVSLCTYYSILWFHEYFILNNIG